MMNLKVCGEKSGGNEDSSKKLERKADLPVRVLDWEETGLMRRNMHSFI